MIVCHSCGVEHDYRHLMDEEVNMYRVMEISNINKSYYCNKECYDKTVKFVHNKYIHKPYVDTDGFTIVNNHYKRDRQLQRKRQRRQNQYNRMNDINSVNAKLDDNGDE